MSNLLVRTLPLRMQTSASLWEKTPKPSEVAPLSAEQRRRTAVSSVVPFFAFGFMDNFLMISFGEAVDQYLCVQLGLSTMFAAAIGNLISDMVGIKSGTFIENGLVSLGLGPSKALTIDQEHGNEARTIRGRGSLVGIILGCLAGMLPLLFLNTEEVAKKKEENRLTELFQDVCAAVVEITNSDRGALFLVDGDQLEVRVRDFANPMKYPMSKGIVGRAARSGEVQNVANVRENPFFDPLIDLSANYRTYSILCVPIFGGDIVGSQPIGVDPLLEDFGLSNLHCKRRVIGVLQVVNKRATPGKGSSGDKKWGAFTEADVQRLNLVASHIAVKLESQEADLKRVLDLCQLNLSKGE